MKRRWWLAVVVLLAGCSSAGGGGLAKSFCSDLSHGLTPLQILGPTVRNGTYTPKTAADRAYGWAATECPGQLRSNRALRAYLEGWGIDPDA